MIACPPATGIFFKSRLLPDIFQMPSLAAGGAAANLGVGSLSHIYITMGHPSDFHQTGEI